MQLTSVPYGGNSSQILQEPPFLTFKADTAQAFVVDETSGCLDPAEKIEKYPLSRNHADMNKFGDPDEEDFLNVSDVIGEMVKQAPLLVKRRAQGSKCYILSQIREPETKLIYELEQFL